jgi:Hom_end-associated Hint/Histidine kinase-, DNA gyrase B-, and HSP90-like ATPase
MLQKKRYQKMDPILHVITRPDMYVGSIRLRNITEYIAEKEVSSFRIHQKEVMTSPAILRIFVEALSNAIDNVERSKKAGIPCTKIKVSINQDTGETSIWNDGDVVPVEMDNEEKCYNHSMIFGQLLTGSNYNDEEERVLSGRNGLGIKLCLKKGTIVPRFDGKHMKIEDLQIGDKLIGDDGTPRVIVNKCEGNGRLFKIIQPKGEPYIVNENHIICLRMPSHKAIFWNARSNCWTMAWLDKKQSKVVLKNSRIFSRQEDMLKIKAEYLEMKKFADNIHNDNTIDMNVIEYNNLDLISKTLLSGYFGKCVEWEERPTEVDPYILGMWLGTQKTELFDKTLSNFLNDNDLCDNKFIPVKYIVNSRRVRLLLLAGIVDSNRDLRIENGRITIQGNIDHPQLLNDIVFLAKSLGFMCIYSFEKTTLHNNIIISGKIEDIPRLSLITQTFYSNNSLDTGIIRVQEVDSGTFIGIEVSGTNNRFVLKDFTVTHNCNIFSTSFRVTGCDPKNKKILVQEWTNNMRDTKGPKIEKTSLKKGYTEVSWIPDFKLLNFKNGYTDDIVGLYTRYIIDASMLSKVKVYLNDELIPIKNLSEYAMLYDTPTDEKLLIKTRDSEVLITPSKEYQSIQDWEASM